MEDRITVAEAARVLRVDYSVAHRWVSQGRLGEALKEGGSVTLPAAAVRTFAEARGARLLNPLFSREGA